MKSTAKTLNIFSQPGVEYRREFQEDFKRYLETQHPIIRVFHLVLKVLAVICFVLPFLYMAIALYFTYLWATTGSFTSLGAATYLPIAWVNFGLSCSFMVFPWGLDSMLMRAFPTDANLPVVYGARKAINLKTGLGAFFAGLGVTCAGAPGAVVIVGVMAKFIQGLF